MVVTSVFLHSNPNTVENLYLDKNGESSQGILHPWILLISTLSGDSQQVIFSSPKQTQRDHYNRNRKKKYVYK